MFINKINKVYFPQYEYPYFYTYFFLLFFFLKTSSDVDNQMYIPYVTYYECLSIHAKKSFLSGVANFLPQMTFRGL